MWSPIALLAHQIAYYRSLAESVSESEAVTQAVVTVPAWWTQSQRRAYRDALELQGMSCLAMIGEGTGVALNYAMTRTFPDYDPETGLGNKEYHIVYDSGGLSTSATLVGLYQTSYKPSPKSKTLINTTHIDSLAVSWEDVGGVHLDMAIRDMLTADFVAKSGKTDAAKDARAQAKLQKEAVRVKHILSANQNSNVNIESLYDDVDFKSTLSRAALEGHFDNATQFTAPVFSALKSAGLTLDDVTSIIMFGGNSRVPFVQAALRDALHDKEDLIAQNVNSDEAAVLGAAFYAAGLSRQFKMKSIEVSERSIYDISLGDEVIFPAGTPLGQRKSLLSKPETDLELEFSQSGNPILSVTYAELDETVANFTSPSPVVNTTIRLDSRGILSVANAILVSNETATEPATGNGGVLKGLFGGKKDDKTAEGTEGGDDANATETPAAPKAERVPIKFRERALGIKGLTGVEKRQTQQRLASIATFEAAMRAREEARNILEGYLYRLSNLLEEDAENRALHEFATDSERANLKDLVAVTFDWLHENAEDADVKTLFGKRTAIETLESPIVTRFTEYQSRGKAIENFQKAMFAGRAFVVEATKNRTEALEAVATAPADKPVAPPKFTQEELDSVSTQLKDNEEWVDALMEEQVKIEEDKTSNPVIFTKDLDERGKKLQGTVQRLEKKKNPRAPRPPKPSAAAKDKEPEAAEPTPAKEDPEVDESATASSAAPETTTADAGHDEL